VVVWLRIERYTLYMKKLAHLSLVLLTFTIFNPLTVSAYTAALQVYPHSNDDSMQVIVTGGDPSSAVSLHYVSGNSNLTLNLGTTDAVGNLTTIISSGRNNIIGGSIVSVIINNQQSTPVYWPNYGSIGSLTLNPNGLTLTIGQTSSVVASAGSNLSIAYNSNPSVLSASLNNNQIIVTGNAQGTGSVIICASNIGCSTLSASVGMQNVQNNFPVAPQNTSQPQQIQPTISLSQSSLTLNAGQTQSIIISGTGAFGLSSNSNVGVAVANISVNNLTIQAMSAGTSNVSVCAVGSGTLLCSSLIITVPTVVDTTNTTTQNISLSESSVDLSIGQTHNVTISGSGNYYLSQNSNPNVVNASVSGSNINISAIAAGGLNITVCQATDQCANVYVYVSTTNQTTATATTTPGTGCVVGAAFSTTTGLPCISTTNTTAQTTSSYSFTKYLYVGLTKVGVADADVSALQKRLTADGLFSGPITGYFGPLTKTAVIAYQKKFGLSQAGVVGPSTRAMLNQGK
jgi:hypothetical protein